MNRGLGLVDYVVWILMLAVSLGIGVYFHCRKVGKKSVDSQIKEFLLGGRRMSAVPVACSLMASLFSATFLLGVPNEIYQYGVMYVFIGFGYIFTILVSTSLFIPVFYNLDITSSSEYLSLRFSRANQIFGALAFIVQQTPYMGIVLYGPALALSVLINVNVWIVLISMGIVCTIYTTLGGIKAVVWTDVLQLLMMFIGMVGIIVKGSVDAGGLNPIFRKAMDNERLIFNYSPDPRTRHSIWSLIIGGGFLYSGIYSISQTMVQRALCIKSLKQAKISYWMNLPGLVTLLVVVVLCGFVIFHFFIGCDPLISREISKSDQLLPLYVAKVLLRYPGAAGLFVAGILSGGLSTMSSGLNSLAAVTLQDIISLKFDKMNDRTRTYISKSLIIIYGVLTLLFAYVSSLTSKILEAALILFGMMLGPLFGVFTLGMFFPFSNAKGAISGHVVSQIIIFWIGFGSYANNIRHPRLVRSNFNCSGTGNVTLPTIHTITHGDDHEPISGIYNLYAISYLWYTLLGVILTLSVGIPVSLLTGGGKQLVEEKLISPAIRKFWSQRLIAERVEENTDITHNNVETKFI